MTDFLLLAFLFLIAGVVAVPIASRLGMGSVLGYLIAGIAISPLLNLLRVDVLSIQHFAEFGVVMMLFLVGLELEPRRLWSMRTKLLGLGGGQVALTAAAVMAASMLLGQGWSVALAVGLVLSLSSTAIVLQSLNEKSLLKSDGGQSTFSVLLFQDIAVIPMLALFPLLAMPELVQSIVHVGHGDDGAHASTTLSLVDGWPGWAVALATVAAVGTVIAAGNYLTGPVFRFIASANLRELFVGTALLFVIGIALLMSLVSLSPALGTFLAGVVLANSPYRHELESDIDPFKGLLLGLFFMTVGAGINFGLLLGDFAVIIGLTAGLITVKVAVLYILAVVFRVGGSDRWLFSLALAQAGEFGFVLLSLTVSSGVIPLDLADRLLLVVALSMLVTPMLFIVHERMIAPHFFRTEERAADTFAETNQIIVAGHGRVGGIVNRILRGAGFSPTVIDYSSKQIDLLAAVDVKCYFGDATRPDLLHAAGIAKAKLFVVAIDGKTQITKLVRYLVQHHPQIRVIARAIDRDHVYELHDAGCRDIVRETYDSSLRMGCSAIEALGISQPVATRMVGTFDELDRANMVAAAAKRVPAQAADITADYRRHISTSTQELKSELESRMRAILDDVGDD